jgi:hypothetical protein
MVITYMYIETPYSLPCNHLSQTCGNNVKRRKWDFEKGEHELDLLKSKLFIQQWRNTSDKSFFNELKNQRKESCLICLAVISVKRNEQFVLRLIHSLFVNTSKYDWSDVRFFIFNAERNAGVNTDVEELSDILQIYRYNASNYLNTAKSYFVKQVFDYISALKHCAEYPSEYTVIFEEDSVVIPQFIRKIKNEIIPRIKEKEKMENIDWLWIKLFFDVYFDNFSDTAIIFMIFFGVSLGLLFSIVYMILGMISDNVSYITRFKICCIVIFTSLAIVLSLVIVGYPNTFFDKNGIVASIQNAFTVANMYPSSKVPDLIQYLRENGETGQHSDMLIGALAVNKKWKRFVYKPYIVRHTGFSSTRDTHFYIS